MQKSALKKNSNSWVKIRPVAKRFVGKNGVPLPPVDDQWSMVVQDDGVSISNPHTGHGTVLAFDQIHHWGSDPASGARCGMLTLNTQVNFGGYSLWVEPTFRPGEALPDAFGNIQDWKRENDVAYVRSLMPLSVASEQPTLTVLPTSIGGILAFGLVCFGIGMLAARA